MRTFLMALLLALPLVANETREIRMLWGDLGALITDHEVLIPLRDGHLARGKVRTVSSDSIILNRNHEIPRASITRILLVEIRGHKRLLDTLGGFFGTGAIIGAAGGKENWYPVVILGGIVGYAVGYGADRRTTWIQVLADPVIHEGTFEDYSTPKASSTFPGRPPKAP